MLWFWQHTKLSALPATLKRIFSSEIMSRTRGSRGTRSVCRGTSVCIHRAVNASLAHAITETGYMVKKANQRDNARKMRWKGKFQVISSAQLCTHFFKWNYQPSFSGNPPNHDCLYNPSLKEDDEPSPMLSIPPSQAAALRHKPIRDNNRRLHWATIGDWRRVGPDNRVYVQV